MFRIATERDFLKAFRPRDRDFAAPPRDLQFPLVARDYFSWLDPTGARVFLVFVPSDAKHPVGIAFRRDQTGHGAPSAMCDWCHHYGTSDEVGLLTADVSSKRRVGVNVCLDLSCKQKVEDAAMRVGANELTESKKLIHRISRFVTGGLGITPAAVADAR